MMQKVRLLLSSCDISCVRRPVFGNSEGTLKGTVCGEFSNDLTAKPTVSKPAVTKAGHITLLSKDEVGLDFQEPGILTGYRYPESSFCLCLKSLFQLHNETLNIWTQIIPALYFFVQFLTSVEVADRFLLVYLASTSVFFATSTCAHTFNCISPYARHLCFFLDYTGIALYSSGCAVCYYAYSLPSGLLGVNLFSAGAGDVYLFFSIFLSVWSTYLSCATRFWKPSFWRKFFRLLAFVCIWIYLAVPIALRMLSCGSLNTDSVGECASAHYWGLQFMFVLPSGLLYVSHFPERWFPGKFDVFGHSHQIFHVLGALGAYNQYKALVVDHVQREEIFRSFSYTPSFAFGLICITTVTLSNIKIVQNSYKILTQKMK
ncbi:unnamed protein product [Calicophoron daubneyi]|uniref:Uncharacterized protein n=1 Tax=Calicophoron daubneyi TaxID=300641 RepID=A0AAV2THP6_CALDB